MRTQQTIRRHRGRSNRNLYRRGYTVTEVRALNAEVDMVRNTYSAIWTELRKSIMPTWRLLEQILATTDKPLIHNGRKPR